MSTTELTIIGLLVAIAGQTTYTTYRTWRGNTLHRNDAIFVDTSVLMDGRIVHIARTGFIPGKLIIPRSVIGELQYLADNADADKRSRARQGLDVAKELQALDNVTVELLQDGSKATEGVDERLLSLAKKHGGKLCTIDFNLNKVAQVEDIVVLNVNELAKNLRMSYLPGDIVSLGLTTAGSDAHQAVGHLDDGTMVVVEQARKQIGRNAKVEIIRSLQTDAGRMMFAKLVDDSEKQKSLSVTKNKSASAHKDASGRQPAKTKPLKQRAAKQVDSRRKYRTESTAKPETQPSKSKKRRNNEDRLLALVDAQK